MEWAIPFSKEEVNCNCGCGFAIMVEPFVNRLVAARFQCEYAFKIRSWCRCRKWNIEVGGTILSSHLKGLAVDIEVEKSRERFGILKSLILAGFDRFIIGPDYIHVDDDDVKVHGILIIKA